MAVATNPLNTADFDLEYATDGTGSSYTAFGAEVVNIVASGFDRKEIQRLLQNGVRVQKYLARKNYGDLTVTLEYSSATFNIVQGWFENKTVVWLRHSAEDTGGTSDSKLVYKGGAFGSIKNLKMHDGTGDDDVQKFDFTLAVDDFAFTAAS